jgi:thiol-disulfide isomerase/thioredoxin
MAEENQEPAQKRDQKKKPEEKAAGIRPEVKRPESQPAGNAPEVKNPESPPAGTTPDQTKPEPQPATPQEQKKPDILPGGSTPIPAGAVFVPAAAMPDVKPPVPHDLLHETTDQTWEKTVEKSELPVAVMFYSPTCVFCHQMEPYFRRYAEEYRDKVVFARTDVMTSPWIIERYGVRSTPTFKFFCSGKPVQEMLGAVYPALLKKVIDEVLIHGKECAKGSTGIDYDITGYG